MLELLTHLGEGKAHAYLAALLGAFTTTWFIVLWTACLDCRAIKQGLRHKALLPGMALGLVAGAKAAALSISAAAIVHQVLLSISCQLGCNDGFPYAIVQTLEQSLQLARIDQSLNPPDWLALPKPYSDIAWTYSLMSVFLALVSWPLRARLAFIDKRHEEILLEKFASKESSPRKPNMLKYWS